MKIGGITAKRAERMILEDVPGGAKVQCAPAVAIIQKPQDKSQFLYKYETGFQEASSNVKNDCGLITAAAK